MEMSENLQKGFGEKYEKVMRVGASDKIRKESLLNTSQWRYCSNPCARSVE
jgi:hypothetical protein